MQRVFLTLPYPPSINSYWGFKGHRRFLTKKANEFKELAKIEVYKQPIRFNDKLLEATITWFPPDRRIRDIDNPLKPLFDSLVQANLMNDDSQIRKITIEFAGITKGGKAEIEIFEYLAKDATNP